MLPYKQSGRFSIKPASNLQSFWHACKVCRLWLCSSLAIKWVIITTATRIFAATTTTATIIAITIAMAYTACKSVG